ncbi:MAG: TGS domain-containing protein [Dehalococcoidia bacterium]
MAGSFPFDRDHPPPGVQGRSIGGRLPGRRGSARRATEQPIGTVTFLFSDVVSSMPQFHRRGDRRAREFFRRHDALIRDEAVRHDGHLYRREGDGFFISFRSTREALRCAIAVQRGLPGAYADGDVEDRPHVRIGMHVGETIEEDGDYYGGAVNLAARVRNEATADQIVVTELVRELASGEPEFRYRFFKDAQLKGVDGSVRLYELLWRDEADGAPGPVAIESAGHGDPPRTEAEAGALHAYANALIQWCAGKDLSEWDGRYVPLNARVADSAGVLSLHAVAQSLDLQACLQRYPQLVIAGAAGGGKTTGLLEAAVRAARGLRAGTTVEIPAFVQLRMWRPDQDFVELLQESLAARGLLRSRDAIADWLTAGRLLLLLDGVNEVAEPGAEPHGLTELEGLPQRYPLCRLAASTRQVRAGDPLSTVPVATVHPWRPHDVLQYIGSYVDDPDRAEAIFRSLGGRDRAAWLRSGSLITLARNPLMLNVIIGQELTAGGAVRPSRAAVLQAYSRHLHHADARRGSRLAAEVKEALVGCIAYLWMVERRLGSVDRADFAQLVRLALTELRADELVPAGLDVSVVLAELDRRFLSPLLPDAGRPGSYEWSHPLFRDYFAALDLRRRHFPGGHVQDERRLEELIGGDGRFRWTGAFLFLSELLDNVGGLALIESCLRSDDLVLACRAVDGMMTGVTGRWQTGPAVTAQRLAELLRGRTGGEESAHLAFQDPFAVLGEALLERQTTDADDAESLEACIGTALLAAAYGVDAALVLAALALGLSNTEARAFAWTVGRRAGEVASVRSRIQRLCELPPVAGPPEQHQLRQGLILALADAPEFIALELCRRTQALATADRLPAPQARLLARDTLGVHIPLARRLALWPLAKRLEDLCLQVAEPAQFEQAAALAEDLRMHRREQRLDWLGDVLDERLQRLGVEADVQTDVPNLNLIAMEMRRLGERGLPRAALHGLGRVIVNVPDEAAAGQALDVIEELWPGARDTQPDAVPLTPALPRPGRRELVAYPPEGGFVRILVQIVPADEIEFAGRLPALGERDPARARLKRVLAEVVNAGDVERVFAATKSGQVIALPLGATPVDFAYHIHTRLGHRVSGALVNGKSEPLTYQLRHGDRVEALVDPDRELPPVEWLDRPAILRTARARKAVQQALEAARRADAVEYGRALVTSELAGVGAEPALLPRLLKELGFQREETLYEAIGNGEVARREVAYTLGALLDAEPGGLAPAAFEGWVPAAAEAGAGPTVRLRYARCCRPQPGDPIAGYGAGQSVVVHHTGCPSGAASAAGRAPIAMRWRPPPADGVALVRIQARRTQPLAPQVRRLAGRAGVDVLDLAANRDLEGPSTLTLECRGDEERVLRLAQLIDRLPEVASVSVVRE